ncbi:hypothetical protein [Eubacterium sp. 1001713B170207_170306_E7]|uniref:hypothetical protein n=1 Tax=Eubacterium sp. 1001713B170207_170306_E7 TaxID=2787097 RepID=UPI00189A3388|nr:hypothetical protein [Eubacterium sp. 1001713B170207_170306_E7]
MKKLSKNAIINKDKGIIIKIFVSMLMFLYFLINIITNNYSDLNNNIVSILVLALSAYLVLENKNNPKLILVYLMLAYFNYSIVLDRYLDISEDAFLNRILDVQTLGIAINCIFVFMIISFLFSKKRKYIVLRNEFVKERNNILIVLVLILVLIVIFIFGFDRGNGLGTGRGSVSTIYEYSSILFILAYYYSGKKNGLRNMTTIILIVFAFQDLIFGGRVTSLQLAIIFFYFNLAHKFKWKYCIIVFCLGIVLMTMVGIVRGNLATNVNLIGVVQSILKNKFVLDTSTYAFYTSLTFIKVSAITSLNAKVYMLKQFLISMFVGGSVQNSNLPEYTVQFIQHMGGGILPIYMNFYLSWFGTLFSAIIANLYTFFASYTTNSVKNLILIFFVSSTPRWYLYSPVPLVRGMMLFLVCYFFLSIIDMVVYDVLKRDVL